MGVPSSEIGYTSDTAGTGVHEVHDGHVVALDKKNIYGTFNENFLHDKFIQRYDKKYYLS
jgi:hypothetical protein